MTRDTLTISDFRLEQYRLAELSVEDAAQISGLAATDAGVRARLEALATSDAEISQRYSGDWLARTIVERAARERTALRPEPAPNVVRWVAIGAASVLIVGAVMWVPARLAPDASSVPAGDTARIKGNVASLFVYRRTPSGSEPVTDGDALRRGDLIRVAYRCTDTRFGVIVSIDGRGVVTRHLPATGTGASTLQSGSMTLLDQAYELDDAPKWERFFLITSETAFDVQAVLDAARRATAHAGEEAPAALPLPAHLEQTSFLLRKIS